MAREAKIPYTGSVRSGNFKLWKSRRGKYGVEQINVATLDGDWQIKIPVTFEMAALIEGLYGGGASDAGALGEFLSNMFFCSSVGNGYFQRAVGMCAAVYADPALLTDRKRYGRLKKYASGLVRSFLRWRKQYDRAALEGAPDAEEERRDDIAAEMFSEVLGMEDRADG